MKTACLNVNVSSAQMNILCDNAVIGKLICLTCKEIPSYFLGIIYD